MSVTGETPTINATKTADPNIIENTAETVTFAFTVSNTSRVNAVTLDSLQDSSFGDLNGQGDCSVTQVLPAGDSYSCSFSTMLSGQNGEAHVNQFVVTGSSEDGNPVSASDVAVVLFMATNEIPALGRWGLGLMSLLLGWIGFTRRRSH